VIGLFPAQVRPASFASPCMFNNPGEHVVLCVGGIMYAITGNLRPFIIRIAHIRTASLFPVSGVTSSESIRAHTLAIRKKGLAAPGPGALRRVLLFSTCNLGNCSVNRKIYNSVWPGSSRRFLHNGLRVGHKASREHLN
jgi:hypothetical protein